MPTIAFHAPGVTYNGLHATTGPTTAQVRADLATTKPHFDHLRTYYPQYGGGAVDVGQVAKDQNLALLLGLFLFPDPTWIAGDYQNVVKPAVPRGSIAGILIGNEDPQMIDNGIIEQYLKQAKADFPQIPVGTSQKSDFWLHDGRAGGLLPLVDFIGINIYPAWDWGRADANNQPIRVTPEAGFSSFTGHLSIMNCIGLLLGFYFGPAPLVVWRPPNSTHIQTMFFRAPDVERGVLRERQQCMFEWRAVSRWW